MATVASTQPAGAASQPAVASQPAAQAVPAPYAITGLKTGLGPDGSPPPRREIRDLYTNYPEQFNLYLLGLRALHDTDFADRLSFFQIAGIHGVPWEDWDHVQGRIRPFYDANRQGDKHEDFNGGYCVHDSILFPTWHRPFVMLLEQVLGGRILEIAQTFRQDLRPKYVEAAKQWRLPYWDFLRQPEGGQCTLPGFVTGYDPTNHSYNHTTIEVLKPSGKIEAIHNPLFSFEFARPGFEPKPYMRIMDTTKSPHRYTRRGFSIEEVSGRAGQAIPDVYTGPGKLAAPSCNADVARGYNKHVKVFNSQANLLRLFTECDIYDAYASKGFGAFYAKTITNSTNDIIVSPSIEKLHDYIHSGGGGNLSNIQEASFDPLFWLHHCNIDRWQAFWETLHPAATFVPTQQQLDKYLDDIGPHPAGQKLPEAKTMSSYTLARNAVVDETTPLMPFHKSTTRGDFWTSADCRKLKNTMGYTYPEFVDQGNYKNSTGAYDEQAFQAALTQKLDALYNYVTVAFDQAGYPLAVQSGATVPTRVPMNEFQSPDEAARPLKAPAAMLKDAGLATLEPAKLESTKVNLRPPPRGPGRTYFVTWGVQHYALKATFLLYLYLGKIPDDLTAKFNAKNLIGCMTVLGNDDQFIKGCFNCIDIATQGIMVWDASNITSALITATDAKARPAEIPALTNLDDANVVPYLAANLNWCIIKVENDKHIVVPLSDPHLASMVVTVRSEQSAAVKKSDVFPAIMKYATHVDATKGKPSGFTGALPAAATANLTISQPSSGSATVPAATAPQQASVTPAGAATTKK